MLILLFVFLSVSAGKRMYLQHYALRSIFKLYFCFSFLLFSLFICKGLFVALSPEKAGRHFTVFLKRNENED